MEEGIAVLDGVLVRVGNRVGVVVALVITSVHCDCGTDGSPPELTQPYNTTRHNVYTK
jgi:hypothetical protein